MLYRRVCADDIGAPLVFLIKCKGDRAMKKRTKEEMAEYQRRRRGVTKNVTPLPTCPECEKLRIEIKKLTAQLAVKEEKEIKDSPADLFTRTMAEKNKRFQKIGLMAHQREGK
jgi:hypothetical protein